MVRVSAVEPERLVGAIGAANSAAGCDATGELVSEIDSVTSTAVPSIGMTGDVGLVAGAGSTGSGNSEAVTVLRDGDCGSLALGTDPPRALTGENGGITAGWGAAEIGADSAETASADSGRFVSAAGVSND